MSISKYTGLQITIHHAFIMTCIFVSLQKLKAIEELKEQQESGKPLQKNQVRTPQLES